LIEISLVMVSVRSPCNLRHESWSQIN